MCNLCRHLAVCYLADGSQLGLPPRIHQKGSKRLEFTPTKKAYPCGGISKRRKMLRRLGPTN